MWLLLLCLSLQAEATTWYVRPDGGTRYSVNIVTGQCDGLGDAAYPGSGTNQHCAFNDIRLLWQDGSYAYSSSSFPAAGWIGKGGDTYIVRGSLASGATPYRVGWSSNKGNGVDPNIPVGGMRGWAGNASGSSAPSPPAGTATRHTRILGGNWQNCHTQSSRTPIIAGYNVGSAFNFSTSFVDFQCFDISDLSECKNNCNGQDTGVEGIGLRNTADHLTLTDVRIHGMQTFGILGPSGDGSVFTYLSLIGNGGGGWNADAGDGRTGIGSLLVQHYEIKWNGCAEEYPIKDPLPYKNCTDQNSGGYGDGFGTATVESKPGWQAHFDQGEVSYNTQDGLDALHLIGNGSSMTITRTLAYANMGQQIKVGGAAGIAINNLIVGNCWAMSFPIPGTPRGFNAKLSDYCRAGDQAVVLTVGRGAFSRFENNTLYSAGNIGIDIECDGFAGDCDSTSRLSFQNNIIIGFPNHAENGNQNADGRNPTAVYNNTNVHPFTNSASLFRNNTIFQQRSGEPCPMGRFDRGDLCSNPRLRDQNYHPYGFGDMRPEPSGPSVGSGISIPEIQSDFQGTARPVKPSRGALEPSSSAPVDTLRNGMNGGTEGDHTGGGGGALPNASTSSVSEVFSAQDEQIASAENLVTGHHSLPHGLLRPVILCAAVISGAGLLLLRRVVTRREG